MQAPVDAHAEAPCRAADLAPLGRLAYSGNLFITSTASFFLRWHARTIEPEAFGPGRLLLAPAVSMVVFGSAAVVCLYSPVTALALWWCALASPWIDRRWGFVERP